MLSVWCGESAQTNKHIRFRHTVQVTQSTSSFITEQLHLYLYLTRSCFELRCVTNTINVLQIGPNFYVTPFSKKLSQIELKYNFESSISTALPKSFIIYYILFLSDFTLIC